MRCTSSASTCCNNNIATPPQRSAATALQHYRRNALQQQRCNSTAITVAPWCATTPSLQQRCSNLSRHQQRRNALQQ
ncbi:unnamed protein product [Sphagnum troendelagicum]|uniref:Uncharacterized protein n=1 Tax=Sphagnum troendelagicum TaxID=128251 RepID=A0ABP0TEH9_9BRYO